jgi:predicted dehydrogenase
MPIRIGIIGCGAIAQVMHLPHLRDMDDLFEIAALADAAAETLQAVGDHYGVAARYTDYNELLARPDIDAVGIFTPATHTRPAVAALRAGKHVFCEKPLCYTQAEIDELRAAAHASGRHLMVAYMKRYDPGYRYARERVLAMSDLRYVRVTVIHPHNDLYYAHHRIRKRPGAIQEGHIPPPDEAALRRMLWDALVEGPDGAVRPLIDSVIGAEAPDDLRLAYALMINSLIHDINALRGLIGMPQRVVSTDIWNRGQAFSSVWSYGDGLRAHLTWVLVPNLKDYHEELAFFGANERVRFVFPSPYLRHHPTPVIEQGGAGELMWEKRVIVNYEEEFRAELKHFAQVVSAGSEPHTGIDDAEADLALARQMIFATPYFASSAGAEA